MFSSRALHTLLTLTLYHTALATSTLTFNPSLRCSDGPLLPTPSYNLSSAIFTVCAETVVQGALAAVYAATIDFPAYARWNSFVFAVDVPPAVAAARDVYVGMPFTMHTRGLLPAGLNSTSNEEVSGLSPVAAADGQGQGQTAASVWKFVDGVGGWFSEAEHPNLITDLGDGSVRVVSYETYYGLGAVVIGALLKENLQREFEAQAGDLKGYVEAGGS